jgi:hypothetical protein
MGRRGRRCKQLLNGLLKMRQYWNLEEDVLDRSVCITRFETRHDPVVR